jgi:hypothetical protein
MFQMAKEVKTLDPSLIESRKEVVVEISIRGLAKAYSKFFHDKPVEVFQAVARKADDVSKKMMTGYSAAVMMPLGIMVRNGARVAHEATTSGRWAVAGGAAGVVGALASVYFGSIAGAEYLQSVAPALSGTVGTIGTYAVTGAASALFLATPAFTVGELAAASMLSVAATGVSVLPAALNVPVALRRSKDRAMGITYNNDIFDKKVEAESLSNEHSTKKYSEALNALRYVSFEQKKELYGRLGDEFAKAAKAEQETAEREAKAAAKAKPVSLNEELDSLDQGRNAVRKIPNGPAAQQ